MITRPFPFNAFYAEEDAPDINGDDYRLEVAGRVQDKRARACRSCTGWRRSAGDAPYLRRGLERHRQVGRRAVRDLSRRSARI